MTTASTNADVAVLGVTLPPFVPLKSSCVQKKAGLAETRRRSITLLAVTVVLGDVSACVLHGPALTPVSHVAYNEAVQQSEQRELLLNLVRLRYLDRPEFLSISSISSQMQFEAQASLSGSFGTDQAARTGLYVPGAVVGYTESPTVIFTPQGGQEFMRAMVSPIDINSLYLLIHYGWSLDRLLRIIVEEVNGIRNVATRESMTAEDTESAEDFANVVDAMQSLYTHRMIEVDVVERWAAVSDRIPSSRVSAQDLLNAANGGYRFDYDAASQTYALEQRAKRYVLRVAPETAASPEFQFLRTKLGLREGQSEYELVSANSLQASPGSTLVVRTRSVLGAMAYLSRGVTVPDGDPLSPILGSTDLGHLFNVVSSKEEPADALAAVPYRGRWFLIEASDLESRRTLGALLSLLRLEIGAGGSQNVPILTLPVAR